jgi:anti-sigma factor RsiW
MSYSPDEWRELIPLYLNGRLSERERKEFEDCLQQYPELKREFREFSDIKEAYKGIEKEVSIPSHFLYQRILRKVESEAAEPLPFLVKVKDFFRNSFSSPRVSWGVAAVQLAIILLLLVNLFRGDGYVTLTLEDSLKNEGTGIHVVFDMESQEREIREVLQKINGTIVAGPSPEGLYTIKVEKKQEVEEALKLLRETKFVRFAERVY